MPRPLSSPRPPRYDSDLALRELTAADPRLGKLIERAGPFTLRVASSQSPFEALVESIVYQQLHGKAAATIHRRLLESFSHIKSLALRDLAAKTVDGTVPTLARIRRMSDEAIIEHLTQVRGIGRWTVEMLLIFRLGRPDVLPVSDYGVRKGFAKMRRLAELPKPKELMAYGERWRPYRSVA